MLKASEPMMPDRNYTDFQSTFLVTAKNRNLYVSIAVPKT